MKFYKDDMKHNGLNIQLIEVAPINKTSSHFVFNCLVVMYRRYFKKYSFMRETIREGWKYVYPRYKLFITYLASNADFKWRNLVALKSYVKMKNLSVHQLMDIEITELDNPKVFPKGDAQYLELRQEQLIYPKIVVAKIREGVSYGATNMVIVDDMVIHHDLFDCNYDRISEELHSRAKINYRKNKIRWLLNHEKSVKITKAAVFVDACAENYAHWLTEVLPRIAIFCLEDRYKNIPIIVNDGLHANILSSLEMVVGGERKVWTLPAGRAAIVDELYVTSVVGYVPFGRRKECLEHSHGAFSPGSLAVLKNHMLSMCNVVEDNKAGRPQKIFLRRNSDTRAMVNSSEIEELLIEKGFVIIETDKLSFLEQVKLFNNAKQIISPTGAALANAIFCKPKTKIAVLMGKHKDMIYRYWLNILAPLQLDVSYVLGEIVKNRDLGIHGNFFIDLKDVLNLLQEIEE